MLTEEQKSELTREKNLWQIYLLSRRIPSSKFNRISLLIGSAIMVVHVITTNQDTHEMTERVLKWAELGFGFAISTLGFLIAGFTVFATLSKPSLLLEMARQKHDETQLSYLKYNFFIFFRVFIYYLIFSGVCLSFMILAQPKGFISQIIHHFSDPECVKRIFVSVAMVLIASGFLMLLLQLKSFTFNIYHSVMTSIRWIADHPD